MIYGSMLSLIIKLGTPGYHRPCGRGGFFGTSYTSGATDADETGLRATWGHEFVCVDFALQLAFGSGNTGAE